MNKEVEYLKEHLYEIYKYKKSMKDLTYDMDIEHLLRACKALDYSQKEIERLNNIIDTMLEFSFFKEECPLNFEFEDEKEEKAQDVIYEDDYCEGNCNDIYKKCWLKYFEKLQKLKENK